MVTPADTSLPYTTPDELWQIALSELRGQMTKATFNSWLADSRVLTEVSVLHSLVIAVCNQFAQTCPERSRRKWLTHRLTPVTARTLTYIAGAGVEFCFVSGNDAQEAAVNLLEEQIHDAVCRRPKQVNTGYTLALLPSRQREHTMTNLMRIRIYSHLTQSRFLHVEDALAMGKLRLFAGNYRQGHGMNAYAHAYMDIADARVIFAALARGEQGFRHKEYKGTPPRQNRAAISRVLSVVVKGEKVYMELKSGPGKLTDTGAILPNGRSTVEVNVGFKLYEARRMAATVLAYIHVWDVLQMMGYYGLMTRQQMVSQPPPDRPIPLRASSLAPVANPANVPQSKPHTSSQGLLSNDEPAPDGAIRMPVVAANGRPITRPDPSPKPPSANAPAVGKLTNSQPRKPTTPAATQSANSETAVSTKQLQYGDGCWVDRQNLIEVQTFQRYVAEMKAAPKSKTVLLAYYHQAVEAKVHVVNQ